MTGQTFALAALWSYGLAAVAYLLLALRMALGLRGRRGALLLAAMLVTTVWALCSAWFGHSQGQDALFALNIADTLRYALWFGFIAALLAGATAALPRWMLVFGGLLLITSILLAESLPLSRSLAGDQRPEYAARVGLAILGLVHVEQLYRHAHPQSRWGIKPLAVSLSAMFGFGMAGMIIERRDQVLMTFLEPASFCTSTFLMRWSSTKGPFLRLRGI